MKKLFSVIESLITSKFYGSLIVKFQGGKITHVEKHESLSTGEMYEHD